MKGKELDREIELELIKMVGEGYQSSPISQINLFRRLNERNIIGRKSTLTARKELIEHYRQKQIDEVRGVLGTALKQGSNQTRAELIEANARLRTEVDEAKKQVMENTSVLIDIVKTIRKQTKVQNIERVLSPFLIRELND